VSFPWAEIFTAAGTAFLIFVGNLIWKTIRKRVSVSSPFETLVKKMSAALDTLIEIQGPLLESQTVLLEVAKGECNGNIERALDVTRAAKEKFDAFCIESAKSGEVNI
jgi:hypothetical protein